MRRLQSDVSLIPDYDGGAAAAALTPIESIDTAIEESMRLANTGGHKSSSKYKRSGSSTAATTVSQQLEEEQDNDEEREENEESSSILPLFDYQ